MTIFLQLGHWHLEIAAVSTNARFPCCIAADDRDRLPCRIGEHWEWGNSVLGSEQSVNPLCENGGFHVANVCLRVYVAEKLKLTAFWQWLLSELGWDVICRFAANPL